MTDARLLKAWEEVVSLVEAWAADPSSRTDASCNAFDKVLLDQRIFTIRDGHQVKGTPGSLAMWQKLVLEKKMPLRLGRACCRVLDDAGQWPHGTYLVLRSWYAMLLRASAAGVSTDSDESSSSSSKRAASTALGIGKQLQESGLLQRLPGLMTATAQQLQAAAGIDPAAATAAGPGRVPAPQLSADDRERIELTVELLRIVSVRITGLYDEAEFYRGHGVAFVEPEGRLAVAGMQYLSTVMRQLQQLGSPVATRHVLLLQCFSNYAHNCASGGSMANSGGLEQLLGVSSGQGCGRWLDMQPGKPSYLLQCACLASTLAAVRGALPAELIVTHNAPPLSTEDVRQMSRLWQRCCRADRVDAVPDVCAAMARLLGCSTEVLMWAAGREDADGEVQRSVHMMQGVMQYVCAAQMQDTAGQRSWNREGIQAGLPLLWQLPAVALLWAAQHPTGNGNREQDRQCVLACNSASKLCASVLYHALRLQHFLHGYDISYAVQLMDEGGSRAPLPALFLQVCQPLQCKILTQLLQLQRASVAGAPGALPSAIDPMPWTSITDLTSGYPPLPLTAVVDSAAGCLHIMVQHTMRPDAGAPSRQRATARQLCPVFEDMLRGQAESFSTPGRNHGLLPQLYTLAGLSGLLNGEMPGWQIGPLADPITELAEPKALQLWGLLCTMMKFAGHTSMRRALEAFSPAALFQGIAPGLVSSLTANPHMPEAFSAQQYVDVGCAAACRVLGDVLNTRGAEAVDAKTAGAMLPWLALLGRGFSFFGAELQAMLPLAAAAGQSGTQAATAAAGTASSRSAAGPSSSSRGLAASTQFVQSYWSNWTSLARLCKACLGGGTAGSSAAAHLTSLGYDLQPLLQQAQRMTAALQEAAGATGTQQRLSAYQELSTQLTAVGELLCSFAHPYACNNPGCVNLSGPSEMRLVTGHSTKCGGCRAARYCSRQCLKQHWKQHKPVCKALAEAAASAAAASSAAPASAGFGAAGN